MLLVDEGRVALDDPIARWLPELAAPQVVRTPESPLADLVPAARPITVEDLLTFRAGWGFPSDFSLPAVGLLAWRELMRTGERRRPAAILRGSETGRCRRAPRPGERPAKVGLVYTGRR